MNRKERRAAKGSNAQPPFTATISRPPAEAADELFRAAVAQHQSGALAEAERSYRQLLQLVPGHAELHSRLGAVLTGQGKSVEAIAEIERALALRPDMFEAYGNLAQAYMWNGQRERAIEAACRALELRETPQSKALFAQCIVYARFSSDTGRFRRWVLRALTEAWLRPRELTRACISLTKLAPAMRDGIARANAAWPRRLPAAELLGTEGMETLARDELLCRLLECDPVTEVGIERLLTNVRHALLEKSVSGAAFDEDLLAFLASLARQCFINEYVFSLADGEAERAQALRNSLERALAEGSDCPAFLPAIVGAYFPLHGLANAQALAERSWPAGVHALIVQQISEPQEERRIAATIPALTRIDDPISQAVRRQYEENPYPRWVKTGVSGPSSAMLFNNWPDRAAEVLIAGCGTGLSTVEFAREARSARVLSIDLSLASLSYAARMTRMFGLTNVAFAHADIMNLGTLGRQFDFIDSSGVLHHLGDPWQGWRILLSLLRPGGAMQVGLYSEAARRNVVAIRALIAERGYRSVPDDIRRCREEIAASADPLLKSAATWDDFFTTSECRDLLFHVQEHRTTLPEIKGFLAANGIEFAGFFLEPVTRQKFAARFPDPAAMLDLDRWHEFESEDPTAFAGMYRFSIRKPAV
jgi:SAM-dependent methyltransferase/tetratricopeptide (TPR) repeat protein